MKERKELNRMVIAFIKLETFNQEREITAREIYEGIKKIEPNIMKKENFEGFKGFARLIPSLKDIESEGSKGKPMVYKIKKF